MFPAVALALVLKESKLLIKMILSDCLILKSGNSLLHERAHQNDQEISKSSESPKNEVLPISENESYGQVGFSLCTELTFTFCFF